MICTSCGNAVDSVNRFCPKCGAPVQPQSPPQYTSPPPYSAPQPMPQMMGGPAYQPPKKKSGCGKIILIVAIILLVLGAGLAAAIYFGYQKLEQTLKASEPIPWRSRHQGKRRGQGQLEIIKAPVSLGA